MIQFKIRRSRTEIGNVICICFQFCCITWSILNCSCPEIVSPEFILSENLEYGIFLKFKVSGIVYTEYLLSGNCVFITFRVQKLFFRTFLCPEIGPSKLFFSEFLLLLRNINTNSTINLKLLRNTALDKTYN